MNRIVTGLLLTGTLLPAAAASPQVGVRADRLEFQYFSINVRDWNSKLRVQLTQTDSSGADLYLSKGALPTRRSYDYASVTPGTSNELIEVDSSSAVPLESGLWYVGVWRPVTSTFDLDWEFVPVSSSRPGMGSIPYEEGDQTGTTFRVWAPNALDVRLVGPFNGWASGTAPLASEQNGNWSLDVRNLGAGDRYKYVIVTPSGLLWKNDPRAKMVTSSVGESIIVDPSEWVWNHEDFQMPAWNDLVIYELHPGTFEDTPGGAPGSLWTARQRLQYLADLGVTAIELMPINEFPGDYSWGYNPSHPFSVESAYGGVEQLQQFIDEAHGLGMAVLLDVVYNHLGPTDLDMWRFDGWSQGSYGGIYFYNNQNAETPWGNTRPDFGRGEVRQYIRDNVMYFLQDLRMDGLRVDSTSNIRMGPLGDLPDGWSLLQWINDEVNASQPWKYVSAEDLFNAPNDFITLDTGAGGAGFDGQWDALFVHPVRAAVEAPDDNSRNMWAVRDAIRHYYNGDAFERVIYTESHDEVANGRARVPEEIWPGNADSFYSKKRSTLASSILFTSPGVPMMFQGQEILEDEYFQDSDPVDWTKLTTFAGIHQLYRDLIRLRRNLDGVSQGLKGQNTNVHHVNDGAKMIAYHRWDQGGPRDDVIVVSNFRNQTWGSYDIGLPRAGEWKVRFNSDWAGYDASYDDHPAVTVTATAPGYDGMPYRGTISIGRYTTLILSQDD